MLDKKKVPRRFWKGLHGIAQHVEKRELTSGVDTTGRPKHKDCLSFVLDKLDDQDSVVEHISVELRAWRISGQVLNSGDEVIVLGKRRRRGFIVPQSIYVVKTGSVIAPDFNWGRFGCSLIVIAIITIVVALIVTKCQDEQSRPRYNRWLYQNYEYSTPQ